MRIVLKLHAELDLPRGPGSHRLLREDGSHPDADDLAEGVLDLVKEHFGDTLLYASVGGSVVQSWHGPASTPVGTPFHGHPSGEVTYDDN